MLSSTRLQWELESYSIQSSAWWCVIPSLKRGPKTNSMKFDAEKSTISRSTGRFFILPSRKCHHFSAFLSKHKKKFSAIHPFYFDKNSMKLEFRNVFFSSSFLSLPLFFRSIITMFAKPYRNVCLVEKRSGEKARKYFNYMASKWIKFQIFYRYFIFSTAVWIALDMCASIGRSCIAATTVFASQNQAIAEAKQIKWKAFRYICSFMSFWRGSEREYAK